MVDQLEQRLKTSIHNLTLPKHTKTPVTHNPHQRGVKI